MFAKANNVCMFVGNVTKDPERIQIGTTPAARFTLAVSDGYYGADGAWKDTSSFVQMTVKGEKVIESFCKRVAKGTSLAVQCTLRVTRSGEGESSRIYHNFDVVAFQVLSKSKPKEESYGDYEEDAAPEAVYGDTVPF